MKANRSRLKQIAKLGFLLLMGAGMNADAGLLGTGDLATWKEEVLLHDGRKIIAERVQTYGNRPTIDSRERRLLDEKWEFQLPGDRGRIVWKTNFRNPPEGDSLMLMLFGLVDNVAYLATSPAGCIAYNHWGRPNPPYVFLKFDGKEWKRISLAEFPSQLKESNVVVGRPDPENRTGTLSLDTVKEDNRLLEPHHRVIVREPITKGDGNWNCEELVYYKEGWISPGDSIGKRMMDRMSKQRNVSDKNNSDNQGGR